MRVVPDRVDAAVMEAANADQETDRAVLIVVENLPVPLDRRVWLEATTLAAAGRYERYPRKYMNMAPLQAALSNHHGTAVA